MEKKYFGSEKNAFSVSPIRAAQTTRPKMAMPQNLWCGMYMARKASLSFGKRNETKPHTHCMPNRMTAVSPTHECMLYMFGMGLGALLCESKTALSATIVNTNTITWMSACRIFTCSFVVLRSRRYTSMAFKFEI